MEQVSHIHSGFYLCPEDFSISQLCETFRDGASAPAEMQARHVSDAPGWYPLDLLPDYGETTGEIKEDPISMSTESHDLKLRVLGRGSGESGEKTLGRTSGVRANLGMLSHFRGRLWAATGSRARAASAAPCRARPATVVTSWGHRRPCRRRGGAGRTAWSSRSG